MIKKYQILECLETYSKVALKLDVKMVQRETSAMTSTNGHVMLEWLSSILSYSFT